MLESVPTSSLRTILAACDGGRVLSVEFLLGHNVPPNVVAILVANHEGSPIPDHGTPESSASRYTNSGLAPSALAVRTPGAYDFDVLTVLAGILGVPVTIAHTTRAENAAHLRGLLEQALDRRDA